MEKEPAWWRRVGSKRGLRVPPASNEAAAVASGGVPVPTPKANPSPDSDGGGAASSGTGTAAGQEREGAESMMQACASGDAELVGRLLDDGADAAVRGDFGATPLIKAAEHGHVPIISLLLQRRPSLGVDVRDDNGDSALLCACRMGHLDAVRVLLAAGADPGLTNAQENNALDAALEARNLLNRPEVSELLLDHRRGCDDDVPSRRPHMAAGGPKTAGPQKSAAAAAARHAF